MTNTEATTTRRRQATSRLATAIVAGWCCVALLLLTAACGSDSGKFRLQGRLRNLNQGEFWLYSMNGGRVDIDTIPVRDGRFAYEKMIRDTATLVLVFPNYSELPIFAEPGAKVSIKGDATHLKDIVVAGTAANKLMTQQRMELNRLMPPDIPDAVEKFITESPESPVSLYLLQRHFILSPTPDLQRAARLAKVLQRGQPGNHAIVRLQKHLAVVQGAPVGSTTPRFKVTGLDGKTVTETVFKGKVGVVTAWATWSNQSTDQMRRLRQIKTTYGDSLSVVSISLDGTARVCRSFIGGDSLRWVNVCDGRMWETPLLSTFGLSTVPGNVVIDRKGRVVARNLMPKKLEEKVKELLKQ